MEETKEKIEHEETIETKYVDSEDNHQAEDEKVEPLLEEQEEDGSVKKAGFFSKKDKKLKPSLMDSLKQEIEKLKTDNAELQDKFLRLYSEFDNYRKRTQKEKLDVIQNASESIICSLLPIIDDMERAIKYGESPDIDIHSIKEGELLIFQKLSNLLKQKGLKVIDIADMQFNTDYHEAVATIPTDNEEDKGKIVEEIEKGYTLNDKVIRFSKVVIYQ